MGETLVYFRDLILQLQKFLK